MKNALDYLLARASESSSWRGGILILTSLGVSVEPALQNHIVALGLGLVGLINFLRKEKK
jgi:hypothetical protein